MPNLTAFLSTLDQAETAGIVATLAGLSITASSLLMNLAKSRAEIAAEKKKDWTAAVKFIETAQDTANRQAFTATAKAKEEIYRKNKKLYDDSSNAMRWLLYAFCYFVFCLAETLTVDVIADRQTFAEALDFAGLPYERWLEIDVGLYTVSFGVGAALLSASAWAIHSVIPKIE
jgi:hypothetical protein